jgi:hypothetical protein
VLRKSGAHVSFFAARDFEPKAVHVSEATIHGKDWNDDGGKPGTARKQQYDNDWLKPVLARFRIPLSMTTAPAPSSIG